jgi:hypothetical protein
MTGTWLAMTMLTNRDPRFYWLPLAVGGIAFALSGGNAALSVWRQEARAPLTLIICAIVGAVLCTAMPAAVRGAVIGRDTWIAAVSGGVLFAAFLLLAAKYVRTTVGGR